MVQYIFVVLYKNRHLLTPLKSAVSKWSAMMSIRPTWQVRGDAGQPAHFKQFSWTITLHSGMKWKIVWRVLINLCDINPWPVLVLTHGFLKPELQDLLSLNLTIFSLENKRFKVSPNIIVSVKSGRCLTQFTFYKVLHQIRRIKNHQRVTAWNVLWEPLLCFCTISFVFSLIHE